MHIACWITTATDTYSEFVTLIASPLQQWLCETHLSVTLYVCCLSCINIMLPSMPWYSKWSHFFRPPHQNPTYISLPPHTCHILETQIIHAGINKLISSSVCNFSPASSYSLPVRSKYTL